MSCGNEAPLFRAQCNSTPTRNARKSLFMLRFVFKIVALVKIMSQVDDNVIAWRMLQQSVCVQTRKKTALDRGRTNRITLTHDLDLDL